MRSRALFPVLLLTIATAPSLAHYGRRASHELDGLEGPVRWTAQTSGVTVRLRGVSAVGDTVAWASGANGTVLRTIDAGRTWQKLSIPGAEALDFRDIDAIDERTAYVLSIGAGDASRIYKTVDGGSHWDLQFVNRDPKAFFNAMAFWNAGHGIAASDSVDGRFVIITTTDGGRHWTEVPGASLPAALPGEGGFAASGTNIAVFGTNHAWIGTGAGPAARVLRTPDGGRTWAVAATPLKSGASSGIFSVAFRDAQHGVVVGGDYRKEQEAVENLAVTADGGATWMLVAAHALSGFRSVVAFGAGGRTAIAVGPSGADWSEDAGLHWTPIECAGFHTFSYARRGTAGWGAGENGRIARLETDRRR
jgi:photosystem II stability/assembly factor-like uncharacterized protein